MNITFLDRLLLLSKRMWRKRVLYLIMLPSIVYFVCFKYMPMYGAIISFKEFSIRKGIMNSPWADPWYKHFAQFFHSPYFVQLLSNTLIISFSKLIVSVPIAMGFAIALSEISSVRYRRLVQTVTYLPHFLSWVIVYGILFAMFSETNGLINFMIRQFTGNTVNFLSNPSTFRGLVVLSEVWKETGWSAIIYLAAILSIDASLYEAAKVDGASRLRSIWHITLPGIRSVTITLLLLSIGNILDAGFDQIYVLYNERVYSVGDIIDTWVYRTGMRNMNFELASAVGLFKSLVGTTLLCSMNALARRWGESLW